MTSADFPVSDLTVRASAPPGAAEIRGTIGTSVATPIGHLPVTGRAVVDYGCDGTFTGRISYAWLVRLGARMKGVGLVSDIEGRVSAAALNDCALPVESLVARFRIAADTVRGYLLSNGDSMLVSGLLRADGDTAYHATVAPSERVEADSAFITFRVR